MNISDSKTQAILVKYHGPTNTKGSRISARYAGGTRYYNCACRLSVEENKVAAAKALIEELGWDVRNDFIGGTLPDGSMAFVAIPHEASV